MNFLFVCCLFATACAHNWINSYSRSIKDNTVAPALPSATNSAHVQVIAGQRFQVEWQQGHGSNTYFILLKKEDADKLNNHKDLANLDKYLAHPSANKNVPAATWQKYHRTSGATPVNKHAGKMNYFKSQVPASSAQYIERSEVFTNGFTGFNVNNPKPIYQWIYPDSCRATDRRTFHTDPDMPWILGMWRFLICEHEPGRADVALFNVPPGTAPGEYILHYRWNGYYDIVDVEVMPGTKAVALPYGQKPDPANLPPAVFQRIPHCEFKNPIVTYRCARIVTNEKACVSRCSRLAFGQCNGVNVVRMRNPSHIRFPDVNIPYDDGAEAAQCRKSDIMKGLSEAQALQQRSKVCYGLAAGNSPGFGQYYITNDPEDPAFFSTCHLRIPPVVRAEPAKLPPAPTGLLPTNEWLAGPYCLVCSWGYRNRRTDIALGYFARQYRCQDCRRRSQTPYLGFPFEWPLSKYDGLATKKETRKKHDGLFRNYVDTDPCPKVNGQVQNCMTVLRQIGTGTVEQGTPLADSVELIRRQYPKCSNKFSMTWNNGTVRKVTAYCVNKTPACCLNVKTVPNNNYDTWEADQTWLDTPLP